MDHASAGAPRVSIVMASFNKGRFLEAAIDSAMQQRVERELIVVDDASTDGSRKLIERLASRWDRMTPVMLDANRGAAHCRNLGLERARGEFIVFLDADDLLSPGCLAGRLAVADERPDFDLWVFPMATFVEIPERPAGKWVPRPGDHLDHFLAHKLDWSIMQPLWRRSFLRRIGGFDESFVRLQDPEMHVRALLAGARVQCEPGAEPDCLYRIDQGRHDLDATPLAQRHVAGAVHFYRTFWDRLPACRRPALTGTLLASLASIDHWRRSGRLVSRDAAALSEELIRECRLVRHRAVMRTVLALNTALPRRMPGVNWASRQLTRW